MQVFAVGGAIRDELLGKPSQDRDYVVVGATPAEMEAAGYKPVGKDFPVFLHPRTKEEYALARTERKTAMGYKGFAFYCEPDVTLEEDLVRRDLTINAMARAVDSDGNLVGPVIDPHGGQATWPRGSSAMSRKRSPKIRCASCAWRALPRASMISPWHPKPSR